jgi:sugar phosphate isomerase/epimerase
MQLADPRLGCSTITFRHRPLDEALRLIRELGFSEVDLGALPGVCDHVPMVLDGEAIRFVDAQVKAGGLAVRSVNADVGDLNEPIDARAQAVRDRHVSALIHLAHAIGSGAIVLPCGRLDVDPIVDENADLDLVASQLHRAADAVRGAGIELWVEALHSLRLCHNARRAAELVRRLDPQRVGIVYDVSHVVSAQDDVRGYLEALGGRVVHVHLRDAVPGDIHLSIGTGDVDFADLLAALAESSFAGHFALELETRDIVENERPAATARARDYVGGLLTKVHARAP